MAEQVTIDTSAEEAGPSLEEQAAAMDAKAAEYQEDTPAERPEWLPEKFKSPEDMAKAYAELERKQGSRQEEAYQDEAGQDEPEVSDEEARGMVEEAGLDFNGLASEYWQNGSLSDESYEALQQSGIPREVVDSYIEAQQVYLETQREAIMQEVGDGSYDDLTDWALNNLDGAEIDAYNRVVETNDLDAIRMAVRGLAARRSSSDGFEPSRTLSGSDASSTGASYDSVAQLTQDMNDPRYESDPAFRAVVERKLERSNIF